MKYKLYEYSWYDHYSSSGWKTTVPVNETYLVHSVGYLIGEDPKQLHFTHGIVPKEGQFNGVMTVLKSALKSKKLLKTVSL